MDVKETLEAASAAISGTDTPEAIKATAQDPEIIIWVRAGAGPAVCFLIAVCIVVLAWGKRLGLWTELTEAARADYIGWMGVILCGLLGLVFWMMMPGRPSKIEVKAGPASITVDAGKP